MNRTENNIKDIISLLKKKLEYYEEILRLSNVQKEAIESNNINGLNSYIEGKEIYVNKIKSLENNKLHDEIIRDREKLLLDKRVNSLFSRILNIITVVLDHEQKSIKFISLLVNTLKTKSINLNIKSNALRSSRIYYNNNTPRYIDIVH